MYKANCLDSNDFYVAKTKRRSRDRKKRTFKSAKNKLSRICNCQPYFLNQPYNKLKWDHFEILATGRSDMHCKINESLFIRDLKPALNENVCSEKLYLHSSSYNQRISCCLNSLVVNQIRYFPIPIRFSGL